MIRNHFENVG